MTKTEPAHKIRGIVVGATDPFGYKVKEVFARGNEYAIYEVEADDINASMRVLIEGQDDAAEKALVTRYNLVKSKYTEAKGLLYGSTNYEMMKRRVAAVLAGVLSSDGLDAAAGNKQFDHLIQALIRENDEAIHKRTYYIGPCVLATVLTFALAMWHRDLAAPPRDPMWQIYTALLAAALGGTLSILIKVKKLDFNRYNDSMFYLVLGAERTFLAFVMAAIAFILVKGRFILPDQLNDSYWKMMALLVAAAFSESLVPSVLQKMEDKATAKDAQKAPKTADTDKDKRHTSHAAAGKETHKTASHKPEAGHHTSTAT